MNLDNQSSKVLITGITGTIGKALKKALEIRGHQVWGLSRKPSFQHIVWDWETDSLDPKKMEGFTAVFHLAGEPIAQWWTKKAKKRILESRLCGTELLVKTLNSLRNPPTFFFSASGISYYGVHASVDLTEQSPIGKGFLASVANSWEEQAACFKSSLGRTVIGRIGVVLSPKGGMLNSLLTPFKLGLGGKVGDGSQCISWIHIQDLIRAILHCWDNNKAIGVINLTAPNAVSNNEFTSLLGTTLRRPTRLNIPKLVIVSLLGQLARETVLSDLTVKPERLFANGFDFLYPTLPEALDEILSSKRSSKNED